jgi:phytoene synthase
VNATPVTPIVAAGYEACEADTRRWAHNFGLGIRLLPPNRRRALSAVYWFSQRADQAVDSDGTREEKERRLENLRAALNRSVTGEPPDPQWAALAHATDRFEVPTELYRQLLDGVATDLDPCTFNNWESVLSYCYGVASVVGLIALRIFGGTGRESATAAEELGYALQLTNILRDVRDDASNGRWYLPLEETDRFGVTAAAVAQGRAESGFDALVHSVAERARQYYGAGPQLYRRLPRSTRACPAALVGVYRGLLERIAADPRSTLRGEVRLASASKLRSGLGSAAAAMFS